MISMRSCLRVMGYSLLAVLVLGLVAPLQLLAADALPAPVIDTGIGVVKQDSQATPLTFDTNGDGDGSAKASGSLASQGMATYTVEVAEGVELKVRVTPDDGNLVLTVVGADGYPLLTDHAGASSFNAAVPATQAYTLTVINFGQSAQEYELVVNVGEDGKTDDDAGMPAAEPASQGAAQSILVQEGGVLVVPLQGNPTTGFTWQVEVSDMGVLQSRGDSLYIPSTDLIGGPGNEVFTFDALSAGDATLVFTYSQPWDTTAPPAQVLELPVTVTGETDLTSAAPVAEAPSPSSEPTQVNAMRALTATDNGSKVQVPTGALVSVDLEGNPTTGYIWQAASNDESVLLPLTYTFEPDSDATGAGGVEHFEFQAIAPGNVDLKFVHSRPWENDTPPTDTFEANIEVLDQAAPGSASILVGQTENGQRTAILQNNILAVQLAGPATGGAWQLVQGNAMILQPLGDWLVTSDPNDAAQATYTRNFLGVAGGKADIQFEFTPTDGSPATQSYSIGVDVIPTEPGSSAVTVATDADAGAKITMVVGDALVLRVPANPSTGYDWRIVSTNDAYLTSEGDPQFASDSDLTGAGGVYTFRFLAKAPGEVTVQMGEYPPGADQPDQTLDYNLTIDTPAPLTGSTVAITEEGTGKPIELKAGDLLKLSLEAIPSTGYHWEITANDGSILRLQPESGFTPKSDLTGAPGTQDYIFRALIPGATTLKIGQFAPGATDAEKTLEYPITVQ